APLLLWLLPRLKSMSAPDMNASDRVAAERRHVLAFAVAGGALMLLYRRKWVCLYPSLAW
ncbi:hypothetical protein ONJ23_25380, partial [Salmonella enterica subsp. enterica serovar Virginia]|nr:hypothetical protein [Salmonella enterica subsp. enterica serovar Virginia]